MRRLATLLTLLALLAGCGMLPESGAIHRTRDGAPGQDDDAQFSAPGPTPGDTPVEIVNGFLQAMTANPVTTSVARSYLTRSARESWTPSRSTLVYRSVTVGDEPGVRVRATLTDASALDSRGGWLGAAPASSSQVILQLQREHGQWRIADPPDELLIPDWFLDQRYQPYNLYFWDQTEHVLVPDRVYVPRGEQVPSQLVRALLNGPSEALSPVVRTEIPPQAELNLSVVVDRDGTADVPLSAPAGQELAALAPARLSRAVAQLAWTLQQVPGVERMRLSVGDTALTLPGGEREVPITTGQQWSPSVRGADRSLYGLRRGRLVDGVGSTERATPGAFGLGGFVLRSFAVRLDGAVVAGVTGNGRSLFVDRLHAPAAVASAPRLAYRGTTLLRPAYDMFGTLWWVDAGPSGNSAQVYRMVDGKPTPLDVPGITGRPVRSFLVSRDGTRIVAVVGGRRSTSRGHVVSATVDRIADGAVIGAGRASRVAGVPSEMRDLRDVVWRSPNDLAVLGRMSNGVYEVAFLSLDGSPGDPQAIAPDTWRGEVTGLVGAPDSTLPLYLVLAGGQLLRLDDSSRWRASGIAKGLTAPTFVG